jgi:hypothetical protein
MHTGARYLKIDVRLSAALSQRLREERLSFTVLAGKPHSLAVIFKESEIILTFILLNELYWGCPAHVCKRRAQLRQSHTLVHTHLT